MARINCCGELCGHLLKKKSKEAMWSALIVTFIISVVIVVCVTTVNVVGTDGGSEIDPFIEFDTVTKETTEDFAGKESTALRSRKTSDRRDLVIVRRRHWFAQYPKSTDQLIHPVEYVVISQTATDPCTTQGECTLTVWFLQVFHVEGKKHGDIAYNFMVAGDGQAYEGRGWDLVGAHTAAKFNAISVGISFVGTFADVLPPPVQLRACKQLIDEGIKLGKISANYKLIADRQVTNSENPGRKLYEELQTWEHWTAEVQ